MKYITLIYIIISSGVGYRVGVKGWSHSVFKNIGFWKRGQNSTICEFCDGLWEIILQILMRNYLANLIIQFLIQLKAKMHGVMSVLYKYLRKEKCSLCDVQKGLHCIFWIDIFELDFDISRSIQFQKIKTRAHLC